MSKKLISAALTATTVVWALGIAALPLANAQTTTASLQAQIAALLAQIQQLQAQLAASTGGTTSGASYNFTSDLTVGSTGAQVSDLQTFLISKGYLTAVSAATGYFGPLTQAAVSKLQAANGITPTAGYFGPKTRAYVNSLSVSTGNGNGGTTTVPTGAPLSVALDSMNPGTQNLAAGAVNAPVLKLDFTAGATPVTVTNLVLTRSGLSQDSDLDNVYLYDGATRLASNLGFNNGKITFSNGAGLFTVPANSTKVITVTVNIDSNAGTGHIFLIGLNSASDVTGGTFSGNFPLNSNQFTIASVSNLATLTVSGNSSSSVSVNAGQTNYLVGQFNVQAGNNPVKVTRVRLTNVGSIQANYLQNVKLMNGSTQLGATIASLGTDNVATFDLSNAPLMLTSGQSAVLSIYADVTGGVNRDFQFSIQQASDIQAVDTTYGVGIGAQLNTGSFPVDFYDVQVNNGGLVISRDAASPTTYAVAGNTNQVLAKFDVLASGDSIKFNELDFGVTATTAVNNFRVVDDQGAQIGTTADVPTSNQTYKAGSGSLNYIIPANTTRVLTVYGDLPSAATGTVQVTLAPSAGASSAQSYTTFATVSVGQTAGNSLTILESGTNLVAALNYTLGSPVQAPAGAQNVKIGSFTFTAGQVNAVNLTGISLLTANNATTAPYLRNLKVLNGTAQVGGTQPTVAANTTYTFNSGAPISIAPNTSVTFDVYADVASSLTATTTTGMVSLTSVNASTGSGNAVTLAGTVTGQSVAFSNGGTLTGTVSAGTPQASFLGMGITGVTVAQYQFKTDTNGSETLTQLNITDSSSASTSTAATDHSTFINYRLTDTSGNQLGTATENSSGTLTFNLTGLAIPSNSTAYVNLMADVNAYPYASSSAAHAFALNSYQYTNASTATTTDITSNNIGNLFTVYQNTLNVTGASFSSPTSISGVGNVVGSFSFTAGGSSNNNPRVETITLSTNGTLIQASTSQVLGLYDASAPSVLLATSTATSTNKMVFTMTSPDWTLPSGSTRTLLVKTYSAPTGLVSVTSGTGNYQVLLQGVTWTDGVTDPISGLSPSIAIPVPSQNITGLSN